MAITKERKNELVDQYVDWINQSRALFVTEYHGLSMKQIDDLRARLRGSGGQFHVIKNTLGKVAFEEANLPEPEKFLEGSTAVLFAFQDVPEAAKILNEFARTSDFIKLKGGYMEGRLIRSEDVRALANLPPLPVMRAQLLGVLMAPASKLARTLAEPARQLAAVLQAYADKDAAQPAA